MIRYFLNFNKGSLQQELDNYFAQATPDSIPTQTVTKSAFSTARKNLLPSSFIDLNHEVIEIYYRKNTAIKTWHGHRLCGIDGSQIRIPDEPEIVDEYGVNPGKDNQKDCPLALVSTYYDVLNHICIDSSINPTKTSEKACAALHLQKALPNDLSLLDRGYNAFWIYALYRAKEQFFCMRASVGSNLLAQAFVESGKKEEVVTFKAGKNAIKRCEDEGFSSQPMRLGLVRVELENEVEVLITNLLDEKDYPVTEFKGLYHLRWGIEENFKRLKQWVEIENFSGKSVLSVKQDFYAKILSTNLAFMLINASQQQVDKTKRKTKYPYQINYAQALSKMKNSIIRLLDLVKNRNALEKRIKALIKYIAQTTEAIRVGRSFKRPDFKIKNRKFYSAYKRAM